MWNTSSVPISVVATTCLDAAERRAEFLSSFNIKSCLELCVGNSFKSLDLAYQKYDIILYGNDIESKYSQPDRWFTQNCLELDLTNFEAVVFAPPLSKGCTGRREDALSINQVTPSFYEFFRNSLTYKDKLFIMTLPARSICSRHDKSEFQQLKNFIQNAGKDFGINELRTVHRNILKYIDLWYLI